MKGVVLIKKGCLLAICGIFVAVILFFNYCSSPKKAKDKEIIARAILHPKNGSSLKGEAVFKKKGESIIILVQIANLKEGEYAVHIHQVGDCSAEDGSSAGGHWNPTQQNHGKWGTFPFHSGDIGNIIIDKDEKGSIKRATDRRWCVDCSDEKKDILNKSIIVHEKADDFISQPSGDAGRRIGCGVISVGAWMKE